MLSTAFMAATAIGAAAPASANQLETAYRLALANDPVLQAAAAQRDAAIEARPQTRSLLLPQVTVQANLSENDFEQTQTGINRATGAPSDFTTEGDSTSTNASLTISQTVFDWSAFKQLKQSDSQVALAQARYLVEEQAIVVRLADAYFNALAASDGVAFAAAEKRAIERQLEQAQKRYEVGLSALTDVQEAQARYDLAVADEIEAKRQLRTTREALREITGQSTPELLGVKTGLDLQAPGPADAEQWVAKALQRNFGLAAERLSGEVAYSEIRRQSGNRYPTLALQGTASVQDTSGESSTRDNSSGQSTPRTPSDTETDSYSVGLFLNWNAFTGLRTTSQIRQAQAQFEQQSAVIEQTKRAVERQTRDAYDGVLAGISRVKALRQAVKSNQTALDASEAGFRVGNRTSVDVLNAQRELFRARTDFARARYDYLLNRLRLKQAAGQLTADDLLAIDALLVDEPPSS